MSQVNRHKLHFGPYRTPRFKYGAKVECQARGEVTIVKLTAGRIPWPVGRTKRATSLVLFKGLARAVRREASIAVQYWWGVSPATVRKWRRALGVPTLNEGNRRLKRAYGKTEWAADGLRKAWAKARDPVRRAKIAAAKLGKPRPPHVIEALRLANLGRKHSKAERRKRREAHKRRGSWPPAAGRAWEPWEYELVRTLAPTEAAAKTNRTLWSVFIRRSRLGLPDGRRRRQRLKTGRSLPARN